MQDLKLDDLQRLALEIGASTASPEEWAERAGFPPGLVMDIGTHAQRIIMDKMISAAEQSFGDNIEDWPEPGEASNQFIDVNLGDLIADACISSFVMGFETAKQFGGIHDEQS